MKISKREVVKEMENRVRDKVVNKIELDGEIER